MKEKSCISEKFRKDVPVFKEVAEHRFAVFQLNFYRLFPLCCIVSGCSFHSFIYWHQTNAVYTSHVVYSVSRNGALWVCELTCSRLYNLHTVSASGRVYTEVVVALRTTQQDFVRHGTCFGVRAEYGWQLSGLLCRCLNTLRTVSVSVRFSVLFSFSDVAVVKLPVFRLMW